MQYHKIGELVKLLKIIMRLRTIHTFNVAFSILDRNKIDEVHLKFYRGYDFSSFKWYKLLLDDFECIITNSFYSLHNLVNIKNEPVSFKISL